MKQPRRSSIGETYTIKTGTQFTDPKKTKIGIYLPPEGKQGEYILDPIYNVSCIENGTTYNALLIYLRKGDTDSGGELNAQGNNIELEVDLTDIEIIGSIIPYNSKENTLIILYHDIPSDRDLGELKTIIENVPEYYREVRDHGPFTIDPFPPKRPKKAGMTIITYKP